VNTTALRALAALAATAILQLGAGLRPAHADEAECGSLRNAYGPFDYRSEDNRKNKIPIVEGAHFQPEVEALQLGGPIYFTPYDLIGGLDYTLRAIPNHHRALASLARYALRGWKTEPFRTPECYFDRAIRFQPEDGDVRLIFGSYLHRKKNYKAAEEQYAAARELMPDSVELSYNLGLLYVDTGELSKAKTEAIRAYALGYPLPGLKDKLKRARSWTEADEEAVVQFRKAATETASAQSPPPTAH